MRKSARQIIGTAVLACLMGLLSVCGVWVVAAAAVEKDSSPSATVTDAQGIIRYDSDDFTVTEDYAAVVPSVSRVTWAKRVNGAADPNNDYYDNEYVWQDGVGDVEMRLDAGRTGLLLASNKTGKDAEGASFSFAAPMHGEFSLDFRVFSEESYVGAYGLQTKTGAPEYVNTFLDLRIIGFTFTSVSDPSKAFTVYFGGTRSGAATNVVAGVGIKGETASSMGSSVLRSVTGYGVNGTSATNTVLTGTTFCNTAEKEVAGMSASTKFSFDPLTMQVFAYNSITATMGGSRGVEPSDYTYIIRDLATNRLGTAEDAPIANMAWKRTLSPEDFAAGYTVEATVVEMTADDTPGVRGRLLKNGGVSTDLEYDGNAYFTNANAETVREAYDRTAKIVLYEVNGRSLQVDEGFDAEQFTFNGKLENTAVQSTFTGYELTAKANNARAEGNVFKVDGEQFKLDDGDADRKNQYMLGIASIPTQYSAVSITQEKGGYTVEYQVPGAGYYDMDPYSDVLQYGVTYRSKTDPGKAFTVHILSYLACRPGINACVSVEGESYINSYGVAGFAQNNGSSSVVNGKQVAWLAGTSGRGNNFSAVDYNGHNNPYTVLRFDPATMTVYGLEYEWRTLRVLTQQYTADGVNLGTTLSASDFAGGFTVEVGIERMNTEWNKGRTTVYNVNQGCKQSETWYTDATLAAKDYVLDAGYDRQAKIRILSAAADKTIDADSLAYSSTATHKGDGARLSLGLTTYDVPAAINESLPITASLHSVSIFDSIEQPTALAYASADGKDTGTIPLTDGKGVFVPKQFGVYVFSAGAYRASLRIVTPRAPVLTCREPVSFVYAGGALTVSADDVIVDAPYGASDVEITATYNEEILSTGNGTPVAYTDISADKTGVYTVTYRVTDLSGREATAGRRIFVIDHVSTAPVVYWQPPHTVGVGDTLSLEGITAIDPFGLDVTVTVTAVKAVDGDTETPLAFDGNTVTVSAAGEIYIYITATNERGDTTDAVFCTYARAGQTAAPKKKGCGSAVGGSGLGASLVLLFGAAVVIIKRKRFDRGGQL